MTYQQVEGLEEDSKHILKFIASYTNTFLNRIKEVVKLILPVVYF